MNASTTETDLPIGWSKRRLFDLCQFIPGKAHEPFIDPLGEFICVNSKFISTEGAVAKTCNQNITPARKDDILLVMSDLPNGRALAKCYLVEQDDLYAVNQRVCILRPRAGSDPKMLFHILNRNAYFLSFNDGVNQTHLLNSVFEKCELVVPDEHEEQSQIGTALSDADALIEGLERLIAKKRLIKQGAMQDLLTAKRRLPGFSGEWGEVSLGNFGTTYGGLSGKAKQDFGRGDGHYVEFLDVLTNEVVPKREFPTVYIGNTERQNHVRRGDLLFNGSSETPEEVGLCAEVPFETDDLYLNSFCFGFRPLPNANIVPRFMALLIRSGVGRSRIKHLAQGATRYNLSKRRLLELKLPIPSYDEQAEIALVSADMDAEIQALEARLEKARQVKEGMMQNLLTGRIRLV